MTLLPRWATQPPTTWVKQPKSCEQRPLERKVGTSCMPQTDEKLKVFLEETDDVRLADDGKSMRILLCGKTPTMDKSNKKSISARLKFFRCGHVCSVRVGTEAVHTKKQRIDEFYHWKGLSSGESEDDRNGFNMVMPTRVGREKVFTSRMRYFL